MLKCMLAEALKKSSIFALGLLASSVIHAGYLQNFNEPNTAHLVNALNSKSLHVIQLGDSHTAADEMTDAMRNQLQSALGNGGLGWGMPMYFSGQRMALYGYDNTGWKPVSSRSQREQNYTLGGFIATPQYSGATLTIKPKRFAAVQEFMVSVRQSANDGYFSGVDSRGEQFKIESPAKNGTWHIVKFTAQLPFTITSVNADNSAIGGWWGKNLQNQGVRVSAIGINGAELNFWNRWNTKAISDEIAAVAPEVIILAYGTNEAFNDNLDVEHARNILTDKIRQIRASSPKTTIVLVSAPETLKSTAGNCGVRPIKLGAVQQMQQQVAQAEKTLFWDWQAAMGGSCTMRSWINQGLANRDGVHFSASGYQKLGRMLANDILDVVGLEYSAPRVNPQTQPSNNSLNLTKSEGSGYAEICLEGNTDCKRYNF